MAKFGLNVCTAAFLVSSFSLTDSMLDVCSAAFLWRRWKGLPVWVVVEGEAIRVGWKEVRVHLRRVERRRDSSFEARFCASS